jgi:hypothetical protein
MAETEQRFTLHARSRNIARIIGYPAGVGLLAAAVFFPFGDTQDRWVVGIICGLFGLIIFVWAWATDRRRRIEVTEQHVTVVNSFSRYVVAWHELSDIEFERIETEGGWTAYHRLAFVTPSKRIVAEAPAGSLPNPEDYARRAYRGEGGTQAPAPRPEPSDIESGYRNRNSSELMKVRDRILHARELSLNEPQPDVGMTVEGAAAVADRLGARLSKFPRLKGGLFGTVLVLSVAFSFVLGLGALIILVLDLILGDWLLYHVAFWDELISFYDSVL